MSDKVFKWLTISLAVAFVGCVGYYLYISHKMLNEPYQPND